MDALRAHGASPDAEPLERPPAPHGDLTRASIAQTLAHVLPEHAIVMNEALTSGTDIPGVLARAEPHDWLDLMGGAIGNGMPVATGAAVACPDRKVVCLEADGSGMYTLQSLWTQAREGLDVMTLLCSNRSYRILQLELARAGVAEPGPAARALTDLSRPDIDWVSLATGLGVPAARVETADALWDQLTNAFKEPGPRLLEAALS